MDSSESGVMGRDAGAEVLVVAVGLGARATSGAIPRAEIVATQGVSDTLALVEDRSAAVVCLGDQLASEDALRLLEEVEIDPAQPTIFLVLAGGPRPEVFHPHADRWLYLSRQPPDDAAVSALIEAALGQFSRRLRRLETAGEIAGVQQALEHLAPVFRATSEEAAARNLSTAALRLCGADQARCWFYDPFADVLADPLREGVSVGASIGLKGFVQRTGHPVRSPDARDDPRFDADADQDTGEDCRWLGVPIPSLGPGAPNGVLVLNRRVVREVFSAEDQANLEACAALAAPTLAWLRTARQEPARSTGDEEDLFRPEAIDHHERGRAVAGRVLRFPSAWAGWMSGVVLVLAFLAVPWIVSARIDDMVSGPAAVRLTEDGQAEVIALLPGQRRPWVEIGAEMRFDLDGFRAVRHRLAIVQMSDALIPERDGVDLFGDLFDDRDLPDEAFFAVSGRIAEPKFLSGGKELRLYSGLRGRAEVRLRSQRLLVALVPALERWFEADDG